MKALILLTIFAFLPAIRGLMTITEFGDTVRDLRKCYDTNAQDSRRTSQRNINGQTLPLPNSIEAFISLVERYESMHSSEQPGDVAGKFLRSFRIDDLSSDTREEIKLKDYEASLYNEIKRAIFALPDGIGYQFSEEDFTHDEKCALHFMLSHTVNNSKVEEGEEVMEDDPTKVKRPREIGVVSLHAKKTHAFALGRVLLGIYAAFTRPDSEDLGTIAQRFVKITNPNNIPKDQINPVYAATMGDLVARLVDKKSNKAADPTLLPNGEWSDLSCTLEYKLTENNGGFVTHSELRGAVDGLVLGWKIQTNRQDMSDYKLSQILRQYYGYSGLTDTEHSRWCSRERLYETVPELQNQMVNFVRLVRVKSGGTVGQPTENYIGTIINSVKNTFNVEKDECSINEQSQDRKFVSPRNIFAIMDLSSSTPQKVNFQAEVIGNLSSDFDIRPRGNLMGVYSNMKPFQQNTLDVIAKSSGIAGCPSCFAKYYSRSTSKADEQEIFKDLNGTFAAFDLEQEELELKYGSEVKAGSPGKIVLYFNYGSFNFDNRVQEALWELRRHHAGVTILAVGDNREGLANIVRNEQTDLFPVTAKTIQDLKLRIRSVPGEFTYKNCNQTNAREADNQQEVYIPPNKVQYWAMYPQYFLKSLNIKLTFIPLDGGQIRVCFTRSYDYLLEGRNEDCREFSSSPQEFYTSNPCKKRNVWNCDPFYFSVESKRTSSATCKGLRCSTPNDVQFIFKHEGISCNIASYISVSTMAVIFGALMFYLQRQ